jgi:hypothetical protein
LSSTGCTDAGEELGCCYQIRCWGLVHSNKHVILRCVYLGDPIILLHHPDPPIALDYLPANWR